jgi:hypothetical protein
LLSGEIAYKQPYRDKLIDRENVLIVKNPKDNAELADILRAVLTAPEWAATIGDRGLALSRLIEDSNAYVLGWETLLAQHITRAVPLPDLVVPSVSVSARVALEVTIPDLLAFFERTWPEVIDAFLPDAEGIPMAAAIRFCNFVEAHLDNSPFGDQISQVRDAMRYTRLRVEASHDPQTDTTPPFSVSDDLQGQTVIRESVGNLWPVRGNSVRIAVFDYDVSAFFSESSLFGQAPKLDQEVSLAALSKSRIVVLFHRSVNLIPCELRIDDATASLVSACDGSRTTNELIAYLCERFGVQEEKSCEEFAQLVLATLQRLYGLHVLVFGGKRNEWGWTGGVRTLVVPNHVQPIAAPLVWGDS